ncbi:MAG: DUF167 domain-containing protein [Rhizobiales bacterium]|nr:DUF167 domain-containing protein [Hyphomicrobiales bacterium]
MEIVPDGLIFHVRLTPRAAHDRVDGVETRDDGRQVINARVRAVPEDGKANKAVLKLFAKCLSHPVGRLSLRGGQKSRIKKIFIEGDGGDLAARLKCYLKNI